MTHKNDDNVGTVNVQASCTNIGEKQNLRGLRISKLAQCLSTLMSTALPINFQRSNAIKPQDLRQVNNDEYTG